MNKEIENIEKDFSAISVSNIVVVDITNKETKQSNLDNLKKFKTLSDSFMKAENELKKRLLEVNTRKEEAAKALNEKYKEFEDSFKKYYTTPVNVVKKVGGVEVELTEIPSDKIENVTLKNKKIYKYNEEVLMKNKEFVKTKTTTTLDKNKIKALSKVEEIDGLTIEEEVTISIKL